MDTLSMMLRSSVECWAQSILECAERNWSPSVVWSHRTMKQVQSASHLDRHMLELLHFDRVIFIFISKLFITKCLLEPIHIVSNATRNVFVFVIGKLDLNPKTLVEIAVLGCIRCILNCSQRIKFPIFGRAQPSGQ